MVGYNQLNSCKSFELSRFYFLDPCGMRPSEGHGTRPGNLEINIINF